jgi:hypothetical protein
MKEPSCGGLFLPPFLPMLEILLVLKVLGVWLSSRLSTAGGCRRNSGISWTRIFRPLSRVENEAEERDLPVTVKDNLHKRSGRFIWSPLVLL